MYCWYRDTSAITSPRLVHLSPLFMAVMIIGSMQVEFILMLTLWLIGHHGELNHLPSEPRYALLFLAPAEMLPVFISLDHRGGIFTGYALYNNTLLVSSNMSGTIANWLSHVVWRWGTFRTPSSGVPRSVVDENKTGSVSSGNIVIGLTPSEFLRFSSIFFGAWPTDSCSLVED